MQYQSEKTLPKNKVQSRSKKDSCKYKQQSMENPEELYKICYSKRRYIRHHRPHLKNEVEVDMKMKKLGRAIKKANNTKKQKVEKEYNGLELNGENLSCKISVEVEKKSKNFIDYLSQMINQSDEQIEVDSMSEKRIEKGLSKEKQINKTDMREEDRTNQQIFSEVGKQLISQICSEEVEKDHDFAKIMGTNLFSQIGEEQLDNFEAPFDVSSSQLPSFETE